MYTYTLDTYIHYIYNQYIYIYYAYSYSCYDRHADFTSVSNVPSNWSNGPKCSQVAGLWGGALLAAPKSEASEASTFLVR